MSRRLSQSDDAETTARLMHDIRARQARLIADYGMNEILAWPIMDDEEVREVLADQLQRIVLQMHVPWLRPPN